MTIERTEASRRGSSIAALVLALALADLVGPAALGAQGRIRELGCRGGPGLSFRVDLDPSPRDTTFVVMQLDYRTSAKAVSFDYKSLDPGTCTWNPGRYAGYPPEPGSVRFDVKRNAQPWPAVDTTIKAGAFFPDPISLPRYLGDARHYYVFYVADSTRFSNSFGPRHETAQPVFVMLSGPRMVDPSTKREIRCRGGTGLMFGGGGSVGTNLASVTMSYRASANVPGPSGSGLSAGSCAWVDRTGVPKEPGKVTFTTASNAQLKQIQSGSTVDRSPTAAVRYPDVNTIPQYLVDPSRYWTFTVTAGAPDKASIHGAWVPPLNIATTLATARATPGATTVSRPATTSAGSGVLRPGTGSASTTSRAGSLFDIRNVIVTPGLEGVVIRFEAAANSKPTVTLTPVAGGAPISLAVSSGVAISSGMVRYSAASQAKLARNTSYNFAIAATAAAQARANSKSGTAKTLGQYLTVSISRIDILSDGDKDGNGEIYFYFESCPKGALSYDALMQKGGAALDWTEGPHPTTVELKNAEGSTPDQVRIVPWMFEDDFGLVPFQSRNARPIFTCDSQGAVEPGRTPTGEWNSLVMDIDLTKYPGAKAGDSFVRRSKPLAKGSTVSFEIRGAFLITRQ